MNIIKHSDYVELSRASADCILETIKENKFANICVASGESPRMAYELLVSDLKTQNINYHNITFTKLDEWCNVTSDNEISCEYFIQKYIIKPLEVDDVHYNTFIPENNMQDEVDKMKKILANKPLDLCILGMGKNGHLGLNEPNSYLEPYSHISALSDITNTHSMLNGEKRSFGMTIGLQEILASKKILFIVSGHEKAEVYKKFLTGKVDPQVPATFLWLHDNVEVHVQSDIFSD